MGSEFETGIDIKTTIAAFQSRGFQVSFHSIGEHVWAPFDQWMVGTSHKGELERNWLKAFEKKLLDYYVVIAQKTD